MRPRVALIENVDALLRRGLDVVLADLKSIGYHLEWDIIPAAAVGAPHLRQRFFGIARPAQFADGQVYGDALYDKHGERVTFALDGKLPRAGRMGAENVALEPIAPRKTKRQDGWSHWVGVDLWAKRQTSELWGTPNAHPRTHTPRQVHHGEQLANQVAEIESATRLFPTATASDAKGTCNETSSRSNPDSKHHAGRTLNDLIRLEPQGLWPTASARDHKDVGDDGKTPEAHMAMKSRLPGGARNTITSLAVLSRNGFEQPSAGLWPTPKSEVSGPDFARASRDRSGSDDLVTRDARHQRGSLNPTWVNWLMGMPLWWTDPDWPTELTVQVPFSHEPLHVAPRVATGIRYRSDQLRACGNSVVPQCAMVALGLALRATPGVQDL